MGTWIVGGLLLVAVGFAGRYVWSKMKKGECPGCSGGCAGCSHCGHSAPTKHAE